MKSLSIHFPKIVDVLLKITMTFVHMLTFCWFYILCLPYATSNPGLLAGFLGLLFTYLMYQHWSSEGRSHVSHNSFQADTLPAYIKILAAVSALILSSVYCFVFFFYFKYSLLEIAQFCLTQGGAWLGLGWAINHVINPALLILYILVSLLFGYDLWQRFQAYARTIDYQSLVSDDALTKKRLVFLFVAASVLCLSGLYMQALFTYIHDFAADNTLAFLFDLDQPIVGAFAALFFVSLTCVHGACIAPLLDKMFEPEQQVEFKEAIPTTCAAVFIGVGMVLVASTMAYHVCPIGVVIGAIPTAGLLTVSDMDSKKNE